MIASKNRSRPLSTVYTVLPKEEIIAKLETKPWWRATSPSVKKKVFDLPDSGPSDCNGCLTHLAEYPTVLGGRRILRIDDVLVPDTNRIFGLKFVAFVQEVANPDNCYNYQLETWRQGPHSGTKGIVLIQQGAEIVKFGVLWAAKFAIGAEDFDAIGGFNNGGLKTFIDEMREELGIPDLEPASVIQLGRNRPDAGMTPNHPEIGAVVVLVDDAVELKSREGEIANNPDPFELHGKPQFYDVSEVRRFVEVCDDSYINTCLLRLVTRDIIKLPPLERERELITNS